MRYICEPRATLIGLQLRHRRAKRARLLRNRRLLAKFLLASLSIPPERWWGLQKREAS